MASTQPDPDLHAVVDMGSNGIRFSITALSPPNARLMPALYQSRASISLYDAQFASTSSPSTRTPIPAPTINLVLSHLRHFRQTCTDFAVPASNISVLATEATRTAPNSVAFVAAIEEATGWRVTMLSKEEEGRIGALGVASSAGSVSGLCMDLGGGSTQITWVEEKEGVVGTREGGALSFPYGAAALMRRLGLEGEGEGEGEDEEEEEKGKEGKGKGKGKEKKKEKKEKKKGGGGNGETKALKEEMKAAFQDVYRRLEVPDSLLALAKERGRFDLYLCGGGFRGWGYVLMQQAAVSPYPIPIINGFRVKREDFHNTASVLGEVASSDEKIYGVSKRRATQIPAVALLVNTIMDALPAITHIQFCQGGVREGFLYDRLPVEVRCQDPLVAATSSYAPPSRDAIRELLQAALPSSPSPIERARVPASFSTDFLTSLANMLFAHAPIARPSQAAAALHSTTTGLLAAANSISHTERALLALILAERWGGDLAPIDQVFRTQLQRCISPREAWWCRYVGRVATLVGEVYPAGRVEGADWRVQLASGWESEVKKKGRSDVLRVQVKCRGESGVVETEDIEKVGKKKKWVEGEGHAVRVVVERTE